MSADDLLATLTNRLRQQATHGVFRVAINGVDGAGKTRFADQLAVSLQQAQRHVIRASIDGFHQPRAVRYARGRDSAEGYFYDSFDIEAFKRELLQPLGAGGSGVYRRAVFDHRSDSAVAAPQETAPPGAILLVDGIFLLRPELRENWDFSVFFDVPFSQSFRRMAARDGSDPDPETIANRRYRDGQRLYLGQCEPRSAANVVVDYSDLEQPRIVFAEHEEPGMRAVSAARDVLWVAEQIEMPSESLLIEALDRLAASAHRAPAGHFSDAPWAPASEDATTLRKALAARFLWLGPDVDALAGIVSDMRSVVWVADHVGAADALWCFHVLRENWSTRLRQLTSKISARVTMMNEV